MDCADQDCLGISGCEAESVCDDTLDNDNDGDTDCADSDCARFCVTCAEGPEETAESCSDGCDNDGDDWDTDGKETIAELNKCLVYASRVGITIAEHATSTTNKTEVENYLKKRLVVKLLWLNF